MTSRLPRNLSGDELIKALQRFGYVKSRQAGSHIRLTYAGPPQHHITVPRHDALRIGTLAAIIDGVALAHNLTREELLSKLFG